MSKINLTTKEAISNVSNLITELGLLKKSLDSISKGNQGGFQKTNASMKSLKVNTDSLEKSMRKLKTSVDKNTASMKRTSTASKKTATSFTALGGTIKSLLGALGFGGLIVGVVLLGNHLFKLIKTFDSLNFTIKALSSDMFELQQNHVFMIQLVDKFGVSLIDTTNRWIKFSAAAKNSGLTLKDTQDIFRSMTKASSVLGLKTDELRGIYLALEQMLSKGKVTTEELRRQLGERLPGAMGIMAASLGVTISQLDKMLKKGEVLSAEVLPNFAKAVEIAFGVESIEKVDNLQAAVGRLAGSWQLFVDKIINSEGQVSDVLKGMFSWVSKVLGVITANLATPTGLFEMVIATEQDRIRLREDKKALLEVEEDTGTKLHDLRVETANKSIAVRDAQTKEELRVAEEAHRKAFKAQLDFNKLIDAQRKVNAKKTLKDLEKQADDMEKALFGDPLAEGMVKIRPEFTMDSEQQILVEGLVGTYRALVGVAGEYRAAVNDAQLALEKGTAGKGLQDDDDTIIKKIKERFDLRNKLQADQIKREIANNEFTIGLTTTSLAEQLTLEERNFKLSQDLRDKQQLDEESQLTTKFANLKTRLTESKAFTDASAKEQSDALIALKEEETTKLAIIQNKFDTQSDRDVQKHSKKVLSIKAEQLQAEIDILTRSFNEEIFLANEIFENSKKNADDEEELAKRLADIKFRMANAIIDKMIEEQEELLKNIDLTEQQIELILAFIAELNASRGTLGATGSGGIIEKEFANLFSDLGAATQEYTDAMNDLGIQLLQNKIDRIDAEIAKEEEKYDRLLELAKNDEAETKIIERNRELRIKELEEKKRRAQIKQAKFQKAVNIQSAISSTALAIINALATSGPPWIGIAMAALVGAAGAAQIATIIATPIPEFADGGIMDKDGLAKINDADVQEYVERGGTILTTQKDNAVVNLQKGDVIHKDYETMMRKSLLLNGIFGGSDVSENDFKAYFNGIESAIGKGFSSAKIKTNVKVMNKYDDYKNSRSFWG